MRDGLYKETSNLSKFLWKKKKKKKKKKLINLSQLLKNPQQLGETEDVFFSILY
jgi:hypothetical protein